MLSLAFSIYDSKTECYSRPFFCLTQGEAVRTFADSTNDRASPFWRHSEDYHLYEIGGFDDHSGKLDWHEPKSLGCALELKNGDAFHGSDAQNGDGSQVQRNHQS